MGLGTIFSIIPKNLGLSWEWLIIILLFLASLTVFAKDFKLGIALNFLIFGGVFVWFYQVGANFWIPLIIMLMHLILLAFSIIFVNKVSTTGGFA